MKDHEKRELVNELRDIAIKFCATQQLRERIADCVLDAIEAAVKAERDACADICDQEATCEGIAQLCKERIMARSNAQVTGAPTTDATTGENE